MDIGEWLGLGSLFLANVGSVYLTYNNFNHKISRIYERFDEYKNHIESAVDNKFVKQEMCEEKHSNTAIAVEKLEIRMTNEFKALSTKIDRMDDRYRGDAGPRGPRRETGYDGKDLR